MFRVKCRVVVGHCRRRTAATAPGASSNWCENITFNHRQFICPEDIAGIQAVVIDASQVRVLGSAHSFSSICKSEDVMLSLAYMRNILDVDIKSESKMSVQVEGGTTLGDLVKYLAPRGMALPNIPSLPHITIAGALATATHGTGLQHGAAGGLPSMCNAIEFVTHDGELRLYERGKHEDFSKSVVHLGALGVVSRVSLDVVPAFDVDQRVYTNVDLNEFLPRFEEVARSVDSLTVGINFGTDHCLLWLRYFDRADGLGTRPPSKLAATYLGGHLKTDPVPFYESRTGVPTTRVGPWHDVPSFFMNNMQEINMPEVACQSEFFVPIEHASVVLQAVRDVARRWPGWPVSEKDLTDKCPVFHCEVRAIRADGLAGVDPFADRDTCSVHFTWGGWEHRARILEMLSDIEPILRSCNARPHFGKLNTFSFEDVRNGYSEESVDAFKALCEKHDPLGKFLNPLLRSQLWGDGDVRDEYAK